MISAYLKLEGEKSGVIKGPVNERDPVKNGSIALLAVEHNIVSPRDPATGQATGKRQHFPIIFTKETDNTSPFFYEFLARNELIKTADFFFYGYGSQPGLSAGREAIQYKILLKRAFVTKVELVGSTNAAAPESNRFTLVEKISLIYEAILWEWPATQASAQDVSNPPNS